MPQAAPTTRQTITGNDMKLNPTELGQKLGLRYLENAYTNGRSLSHQLEMDDPSSAYPNEQTDAFQRVLKAHQIVTRTVPEWGISADECMAFERLSQGDERSAAGKTAMTEYFARQWRAAATGKNPSTRALFTGVDQPLNSLSNPYADNPQARWDLNLAPAIPLDAVVGVTTAIDRRMYRAFYLTSNTTQTRMKRVAEGTELPKAKLNGGDREISLYKYGVAFELTYEQMREMRIDVVTRMIQRLAIQSEVDKLDAVIDVLINGDGNSGTAATNYNLTSLDAAASAGTLTLKGWLAFKKKLANPYYLNTALMQEAVSLQLELLSTGNANIPLATLAGANSYGSLNRINQTQDAVNYGWTSSVGSLLILGFDKRLAVERVFQVGANVQEMAKFINNQTELMTMSETEGYAIMDGNAAKTLNVNA